MSLVNFYPAPLACIPADGGDLVVYPKAPKSVKMRATEPEGLLKWCTTPRIDGCKTSLATPLEWDREAWSAAWAALPADVKYEGIIVSMPVGEALKGMMIKPEEIRGKFVVAPDMSASTVTPEGVTVVGGWKIYL